MLSRLAIAAAFIVAASGPCFAQSDFNESTIPPSAPPSRVMRPRPAAPETDPAEETDTEQPRAQAVPSAPATKPKPAAMIPYTIRPGDSLGSIAQMFGITAEDLAHANRMSVDTPLMADAVLKVPHPFTSEVTSLKSQVDTLSSQVQSAEQKVQAAEDQVKTLQGQVQELTGQNQDLQLSSNLLPWWRATALSLVAVALIMFGVMLLTLFEWWRMRRKFVALAEMTDALSRLDYKYKAMVAKAELRLQQLYGRRRGAITEGQPRPKMPEEIEIERLNDELKEILEIHLQRLGARLRGGRRRKGWREMLGGSDVPVEARSVRR